MEYVYNMKPIYIRLWPSYYWLAIWSAPYNETLWKALRITLRHGEYHSELLFTVKKGSI